MTAILPGSVSSIKVCPELEVLLICATTLVTEERVDRLKILLQGNIDWASLLKKASQHKLMPLLYSNLNSICPEAVPKAILTKLKIDFQYHTRRCLFLCGELVRLLNLFEEQGIAVLPFKGPVLAASAYGNLLLRQFGDLDILVHAEDIERAKALFLAQGYRMKIERIKLTAEQEEIFVRSPQIYKLIREAAYPFIHPQKEAIVELHWGIMPKYFAYPIDDRGLWENWESVTIAGKSVPSLSPENALLAIVGHGTKECWTELNRICDVAEYIRSHPQLDWVKLVEKARIKGGQRMLFLSLMLAHNLLSTPLPEKILQQIQADTEVKLLTDRVCDRLLFNQIDESLKYGSNTRFHLKVRERIQDKIQYFYQIAVTPTTCDWLLLPRAKFPTFIYYFLRPIRLIGEQIRKKSQT
ncbi:nucleotidyltransferase family protein [Aerosakkonemataceae cyanobacterium BLCC-F154]|uniref:Nucleotidyltransferase family protein n=1 Tax=Floridaenema fluviatile BLCC-F154 TaxID=3153640 RepID=A0ABV4YKA0_9CYAN